MNDSANNFQVFSDLSLRFSDFLDYRGHASLTIYGYHWDLDHLAEWLLRRPEGFPSLGEIDRYLLQEYLICLNGRGWKPSTIKRTMCAIRSFFAFLTGQAEELKRDPSRALFAPQIPSRVPVVLNSEQLQELIDLPSEKTWPGLRDRAVLHTFCFLGLRPVGLSGLNLDDYDSTPSHPALRVIGKGDKERVLPVNETLRTALDRYLEVRPMTESPKLFISLYRERWSNKNIRKMVAKYGRKMGVYATPRVLRHSFATNLHLADVDILEIKELMGHVSITSTQIYTHSTPHRLRSAVERIVTGGELSDPEELAG